MARHDKTQVYHDFVEGMHLRLASRRIGQVQARIALHRPFISAPVTEHA